MLGRSTPVSYPFGDHHPVLTSVITDQNLINYSCSRVQVVSAERTGRSWQVAADVRGARSGRGIPLVNLNATRTFCRVRGRFGVCGLVTHCVSVVGNDSVFTARPSRLYRVQTGWQPPRRPRESPSVSGTGPFTPRACAVPSGYKTTVLTAVRSLHVELKENGHLPLEQ